MFKIISQRQILLIITVTVSIFGVQFLFPIRTPAGIIIRHPGR